MLEIKDLCVSYGAIDAVKGISLEVNDGEIVSLIGANGAGKTTTLHAITGLVPIKSRLRDLRRARPAQDGPEPASSRMGLAHVPEGRQVFTRMTVAGEPRHGRVHSARTQTRSRRTSSGSMRRTSRA